MFQSLVLKNASYFKGNTEFAQNAFFGLWEETIAQLRAEVVVIRGGFCKGCQYCLIRIVPLTAIKFLIIFIFVEFLIKKLFQSLQCQDKIHTSSWCIRPFQCCKRSSWSGLCMSRPSPLLLLATQYLDERYKRKQSELFLSHPEHII